jgi:hypothetical protein
VSIEIEHRNKDRNDGQHTEEKVTDMSELRSELTEQLARWTAAGIIDETQAIRIGSAERAGSEPREASAGTGAGPGHVGHAPASESAPQRPRRSLPLVVEVLGYVGAVIAISAAFVVVRQLWPNVPSAATLPFTAIAAIVLMAAGAALAGRGDAAFGRLRSVLFLLSTAAAGGFAAILASDVLKLSDMSVALLAEGTWAVVAVALWWRNRSGPQLLALYGGLATLLITSMNQVIPNLTVVGAGVGIWTLSAAWGIAAGRGYLAPQRIGLAAGAAGILVGAILTMDNPAGQALALLTVAALLVAGIATARVMFIGIGAAGTLWVVPDTAGRYLPGSVAAPLAVTIVGLVLLAIALWLARRRPGGRRPS